MQLDFSASQDAFVPASNSSAGTDPNPAPPTPPVEEELVLEPGAEFSDLPEYALEPGAEFADFPELTPEQEAELAPEQDVEPEAEAAVAAPLAAEAAPVDEGVALEGSAPVDEPAAAEETAAVEEPAYELPRVTIVRHDSDSDEPQDAAAAPVKLSAEAAAPAAAELAPEVATEAAKTEVEVAAAAAAPAEASDAEVNTAAEEAPAKSEAAPDDPFAAVPESMRSALKSRGFDELTTVQSAVLADGSEERDLQISSQTGSGKTVALGFAIAPALERGHDARGPQALIIVPTRELAIQVCEELGWLMAGLKGVRVASVTGGSPVFRDRQMLKSSPRVLVGTPGRLLDHVTNGALDLGDVRELVLDEADQMLDMGFREELEGILDTTPASRRTHLVSATFPRGIRELAMRYQREPVVIEGTRLGDANLDIEHSGHLVQPRDRYGALVNLLLQSGGERTLVFVERRADAVEVAEKLEGDGFAALPLSGELAQSQRERTIAAFRSGRASVLVATDVAARGLDVPDVSLVIHTAPPIDAQVYTHRSGRTGRAGKSGRSVLLAPPNKKRRVARLLSDAGVSLAWRPVPSASEIREQLAERSRAELEGALDEALGKGVSESHLAHAAALLETREAAPLIGALLARLEPSHRAEPRDVETARDERSSGYERPGRQGYGQDRGYQDRGRGGYQDRGRGDYSDRSGGQGGRPDRGRSDSGGRGFGREGAVRFFVNWGANQGASPGRLLAAVCRRGEVSGGDIGAIAVHPNASTFEVRAELADEFARLAGRRDPRDPQTRIRLDRGPQREGGGDYRGGGGDYRGGGGGGRGGYGGSRERGNDRGGYRSERGAGDDRRPRWADR